MNFNTFRNGMVAALVATSFCACDDDDEIHYSKVDGAAPVIEMDATVRTEPGRVFAFKGLIKDNDGIRKITLKNEAFCLNKTIDLIEIKDELLREYALDYKYTPDKSFAETATVDVLIQVEDVLGNVTEKVVTVGFDGDFTAPFFSIMPSKEISVLLKEKTRMKINFTAEDDKALDSVRISMPALGIANSITSFSDSKKFVFSDYIDLPASAGDYDLVIEAVDKFGFTTVQKSKVVVSDLPDFQKMYLADVDKAEQLNSDLFGVPMLVDHVDAFTYRARYYCEKPGTAVCFIPQKTDFEPICFGPSKDDSKVLGDSPDAIDRIVLDQKGYYEITFNTKKGTYEAKQYTPADEPLPIGSDMLLDASRPGEGSTKFVLSLAGAGLPGVGNWSTSDPFVLTQDAENKYLFTAEMELEADVTIEFTITPRHDWGWWPEPFFRFEDGEEDSSENEYNTKNGGHNMTKVTTTKAGKYKFTFDSHLMRSRFTLID